MIRRGQRRSRLCWAVLGIFGTGDLTATQIRNSLGGRLSAIKAELDWLEGQGYIKPKPGEGFDDPDTRRYRVAAESVLDQIHEQVGQLNLDKIEAIHLLNAETGKLLDALSENATLRDELAALRRQAARS